jgi:hypothetical protein
VGSKRGRQPKRPTIYFPKRQYFWEAKHAVIMNKLEKQTPFLFFGKCILAGKESRRKGGYEDDISTSG